MKAYELLSDPSKWTKGEYARNAFGSSTGSRSNDAASWCTVGALDRCYDDVAEWRLALCLVEQEVGYMIADWNDKPDRTYEEVVSLLRKVDV